MVLFLHLRATNALVILAVAALISSSQSSAASAGQVGRGTRVNDPQLESQKYYDLSCDATLAASAGKNIYESREDQEIHVEERSAPTPQPTSMPSESPSLTMPCSDPFSNARGSYTSTKAPCTITFHNEDENDKTVNHLGANRKRYHDTPEEEASSSYYHGTSNVCGPNNKIGEAKKYASGFPDECVGDFARCYDLRDPNHRMCQGLRKILAGVNEGNTDDFLPWETRMSDFQNYLVPPGTTHVSVDCTVDKEAVLESNQQELEFHHEMNEEDFAATKKQTLFVVVSVLIAVLIVVYAIGQLVVQPIVGAIGHAGSRRRPEETERGRGGSQLVSLVSLHNNNNNNNNDNMGSSGSPLSRSSSLRLDTANHDEEGNRITRYDIGLADEPEDVVPAESMIEPPQQIPMDFDAVPIVPATIIPFDAIPAEVMEDGIFYGP